ncbi:MAG: hypothetical protein GX879_04845, partial [Bacteroidales bacterium]|nr:hypothetical protein [Bacteroidales bacterium]
MNNTSGNKLGLIIGIISLASVIVLYALFFTSKSKTTGSEGKSNESGVVSNSDLNI